MIVIDASVLADFLLARPVALDAVAHALGDEPHQHLHAPELIEPETLQALRRLARAGAISEQRAGEAVADLADVRLVRHSHAVLRPRVWALRRELTAYDASYLALAEALDEGVLVTADRGLAARARRSLGRRAVVAVP